MNLADISPNSQGKTLSAYSWAITIKEEVLLVPNPGISRPGNSREKADFKIPVSRDKNGGIPGKIAYDLKAYFLRFCLFLPTFGINSCQK